VRLIISNLGSDHNRAEIASEQLGAPLSRPIIELRDVDKTFTKLFSGIFMQEKSAASLSHF
jgi:hypothetical protein